MNDKEYFINRMIDDLRADKGVLYNLNLRNKEYLSAVVRDFFINKDRSSSLKGMFGELKDINIQRRSVKKDMRMIRKDIKTLRKEI